MTAHRLAASADNPGPALPGCAEQILSEARARAAPDPVALGDLETLARLITRWER